MSAPTPSIRVENLTRRYGTLTAIKDVSFTVDHGEIIGFLGPNGAGKSTTMRILSGIMSASSGSAWVAGVSVATHPELVKNKIGYMPENNPLPEDMRVVEYLRFRARLKNVPYGKVRSSVEEVMEICDLTKTARRKIIGKLSKGFRQRVGIADALLGKPEVILMDEPTIGLDPHQVQGIRNLIDSLRGRMTVILSSHILPEIERSCDRVIIINRGRIVASGTSSELREEFLPGNRYHIEVTGSEPHLHERLHTLGGEFEVESVSEPDTDGFRTLELSTGRDRGIGEQLVRLFTADDRFRLRTIVRDEPNLEDIFLAATKRSWDEMMDLSKARKAESADGARANHAKTTETT